jgi:hypothetical protein
MQKLWSKTAENVLYWQNSTNLKGKLVPALHAWDKKSLVDNLSWLQRMLTLIILRLEVL